MACSSSKRRPLLSIIYHITTKMNCSSRSFLLLKRVTTQSFTRARPFKFSSASFSTSRSLSSLPSSVERVGEAFVFPNEYPGQCYEFNWTLNRDGVTPLKKSAFRITKPLDLKIAGLEPHPKSPLAVKTTSSKKTLVEAGSDQLSFDDYDEVTQRTKDLLSLSDTLYCPEGHMPATTTTVRIITNSDKLAPKLVAYLDRAPKRESTGCSITAYILEDASMEAFASYAIEETGEGDDVRSVAAVVCTGKAIKVEQVVAGLELSLEGLVEDEEARKKEAEEAAAATEK